MTDISMDIGHKALLPDLSFVLRTWTKIKLVIDKLNEDDFQLMFSAISIRFGWIPPGGFPGDFPRLVSPGAAWARKEWSERQLCRQVFVSRATAGFR